MRINRIVPSQTILQLAVELLAAVHSIPQQRCLPLLPLKVRTAVEAAGVQLVSESPVIDVSV